MLELSRKVRSRLKFVKRTVRKAKINAQAKMNMSIRLLTFICDYYTQSGQKINSNISSRSFFTKSNVGIVDELNSVLVFT